MAQLPGHVPSVQISRAQHLGRQNPDVPMQIAIALSPANASELAATIERLYNPADPLYHQFLTESQFTESYAPSAADFNQVAQYFTSRGLSVVKAHPNRLVLDLAGTTSQIEGALQLEVHNYLTADGRIVHAPTTAPLVSDEIASKLTSIVGLSSFNVRKKHLRKMLSASTASQNNYMTPSKIKTAYGLSGLSETGSGEILAVFELDGYTASDITSYFNYFGITAPTLKNVLINGVTGVPSTGADSGADEVTLDIELAAAIAPGATELMVYEAPNTDTGALDGYSRIASDNIAKEISTSWGISEQESDSSTLSGEYTLFEEMAAQGQSIFAAAGDSGAYDDPSLPTTLAVDDPGSQPYVVSAGGTTLGLGTGNVYGSESSWNTPASGSTAASGGGGGISNQWGIPSWQARLATTANKGSTTMRMVPDVSINGNPDTGYSIYFGGAWVVFGGTSCSAPIWAGFTALVNQARVTAGLARLGYPNPSLYQLGQSSLYSGVFHDIADGSTNLYYPAVTGYDLSTGWGSMNGSALLSALASATLPPNAPTALTLMASGDALVANWDASVGATAYTLLRSTSSDNGFVAITTGLSATSYTDSGLTAGTVYYYEVQASNSAGQSSYSAVASSDVSSSLPQPPVNIVVTVIR
jgi:kumamolisin